MDVVRITSCIYFGLAIFLASPPLGIFRGGGLEYLDDYKALRLLGIAFVVFTYYRLLFRGFEFSLVSCLF